MFMAPHGLLALLFYIAWFFMISIAFGFIIFSLICGAQSIFVTHRIKNFISHLIVFISLFFNFVKRFDWRNAP